MKRIRIGIYEKNIKDKRIRYKHDGKCIDCGAESDRCRCEKCRTRQAAHMRKWRSENLEHCHRTAREWRIANPERDKEIQARATVKRKYGLTLAEYHKILESPCGICGGTNKIVLDTSGM